MANAGFVASSQLLLLVVNPAHLLAYVFASVVAAMV